jgi:hypothetical protein
MSYSPLPHFISFQFGGKTISVEQFILRKSDMLMAEVTAQLPNHRMLCLEMTYLYAAFDSMSQTELEANLERADAAIAAGGAPITTAGGAAVVQLVRASLLRNLGRYDEAVPVFKQLAAESHKSLAPDTYVVPFARLELATVALLRCRQRIADIGIVDAVALHECQQWLKQVDKFKPDYNMKVRLQLRHHMCKGEVRQLSKLAKAQVSPRK